MSNKLSNYVEKDFILQIINDTYDMYKNILKTIPATCSGSKMAKATCDIIENWLKNYNDILEVRLGLNEDEI